MKSAGKAQQAVKILNDFLRRHPQDPSALSLLAQSALDAKDRCQALQARGRYQALLAAYPQALNSFAQAMNYCSRAYDRDIVRALTAQVSEQRAFDDSINKDMR